jgi:CheY-like chemotaxis protein
MQNHEDSPRWLVVDDDPAVLEVTVAVLRLAPGVEVVPASDPRAALEILRTAPGGFELVVTDFNMPHLDGLELARRARELAPGLKVLMVTGSGLGEVEACAQELDGLLAKPYRPGDLLAAARAARAGGTICLV